MNDTTSAALGTGPKQIPHPGDEYPAFPVVRNGIVLHGGMTCRQHAAIALRVPDSGLPWIDAMIQRARRDDFAKHIAAAYLSADNLIPENRLAEWSFMAADAMLAADAGPLPPPP